MVTSTSLTAGEPRVIAAGKLLLPVALLAVAADQLFRAAALGLNFSLWVGLTVFAWWAWRGGQTVVQGRGERALLVAALLLGAGVSWRENEMLRVLDILGIGVIFGLLPFAAAIERDRPAVSLTLGRLLALAGQMAGRGARGPVPALLDAGRRVEGRPGLAERAPVLATVRGLALGVPMLLLFGGLLGQADPQFGQLLTSLVRIDLRTVSSHAFGIGVGAWLSAALLGGILLHEREQSIRPLAEVRRSLGLIELGLTLGMLDLLFGGFIAFQLPYFFGGTELVLTREGLTFADYARRGFGELFAVSALVLPLLLVFEPRVAMETRGARRVFTLLAQCTLVLLLVIMGSALHRMALYTSQYGLTEDRFFATAFMTGIGVTAFWFSATVLRGAAHRFLPGAIAAWVAWLGALHVVNPEVYKTLRR